MKTALQLVLIAFAVSLPVTLSRADDLALVADINDVANDFYRPADLTVLGNAVLFTKQTVAAGRELWRLDTVSIYPSPSNHPPAPERVKDINPGTASAFPEFFSSADQDPFEVAGGFMYFKATDGVHGFELWKTDGTEAGTALVKDIRPGAADAFSTTQGAQFTALGNIVYFVADDGEHGNELWRSDGTEAGTYMITDLRAGASGSSPLHLTIVDGILFFSADNGSIGRELWLTDGTEIGTQLVADIRPGPFGGIRGDISEFEALGDRVFFTSPGNTSTFNMELWVSDGTAAGTYMVKEINPASSSYPTELFANKTVLYFFAIDGATGYELWRSDGTEAGTLLVKDISPGSTGSIGGETQMVAIEKTVYFFARSGDFDSNNQLWKSNGTESGTVLVADLDAFVYDFDGASLIAVPNLAQVEPFGLSATRHLIYFTASDGVTGQELWVSKGVPGSFEQVEDINLGAADSRPSDMVRIRNRTLFVSYTEEVGNQLYEIKAPGGVSQRSTFVNQNNSAYYIDITEEIAGLKDRALFFARQGNDDVGLFITDGTAAGTTALKKDVIPHDILAQPILDMAPFQDAQGNHLMIFGALDNTYGYEPWITDGTIDGTKLLKDIYPGPSGSLSADASFEVVDHHAFFVAADPAYGGELWKTDGTEPGTKLVKDIWPGPMRAYISEFKAVGKFIFLEAEDGVHGSELWRTDGTEAGTVLIDIVPGSGNSFPYGFRAWKNFCLFNAETPAFGGEPWLSDGKPAGTFMLRDIAPGANGSFAGDFTALEKVALFRADNGSTGWELWRTDGTAAGTVFVKDIYPGPGGSYPFIVAGKGAEVALIDADDGTHGHDLWRSDGTTAGTFLLKDIFPGSGSSWANYFAFFNPKLAVFSAYDGEAHGNELWVSDFTVSGTRLVKDLYPGANNGIAYPITEVIGGTAYFYANEGVHGYEIWRYKPSTLEPPPPPLPLGKPKENVILAP